MKVLKRFIPYMGKKKVLLPFAIVLTGVSAILGAIPYVLIWIIAKEILKSPETFTYESISGYAVWIGLSAILSIILYFTGLMCSHLAAFRVEVGIQKVGMKKLLNKPLGYFDSVESGKIRKVINDGANTTHNFLAHQLPDSAGSIVTPLFLFITMILVDWRMGIAALVPIILGMFTMMSMMKNNDEFLKEYYGMTEKMSNEAIEYVRGIPIVKTFGHSVFSFKRFYDSIILQRDIGIKYVLSWKNQNSFFVVILQTSALFLIPMTIFLLTNTDNVSLVITNFVFYLILAPNFMSTIIKSAYFSEKSAIAKQAIDSIEKILDFDDLVYKEKGSTPSKFDIEFKDVVFAYNGSEINAVDGVSFSVAEGETVALVGASGSGKTTIARLAARFWDAKSGKVLIGGTDIKEIAKDDLMQNVSFVFQNTKLFSETLRDNIKLGNENASEIEVNRAVDLSQSREIIDGLRGGLDTVIGTQGTYLSGGEQQRISLARAILKNSPIVILDEATAFADPENEHLVQKALRELSAKKTTLMIAHRLSSVVNVDKILVVSHGKIVERGTHSELMTKNAIYAGMYREYEESINWKLASAIGGRS